jgi:hypothetical protein
MASKGNTNALVHGGSAARQQLSANEPFTGIARDVEVKITADYAAQGPAEMLKLNAIRLLTVAELYWQAILGATDATKLESYVKTYGWLSTASARLLGQLREMQSKEPPVTALEVLNAIKGENNDTTD